MSKILETLLLVNWITINWDLPLDIRQLQSSLGSQLASPPSRGSTRSAIRPKYTWPAFSRESWRASNHTSRTEDFTPNCTESAQKRLLSAVSQSSDRHPLTDQLQMFNTLYAQWYPVGNSFDRSLASSSSTRWNWGMLWLTWFNEHFEENSSERERRQSLPPKDFYYWVLVVEVFWNLWDEDRQKTH